MGASWAPLGRSWVPLERFLGASGPPLDISWMPPGALGRLLDDFLALGRARGMVLEGFGRGGRDDFGRVWGRLGISE